MSHVSTAQSDAIGMSVDKNREGAIIAVESNTNRRALMLLVVLAIAFAFAPLVIYPVFLMKIMCFAIFASSVNLLLGHGGLLSFGHAAFFGLSAYCTGYLAKNAGLTPEMALIAGVVASLTLGAVFGAIAVRRSGIYFAMITLALAQFVYFMAVQNPQVTGGEDGLQSIPRGALFGRIQLDGTTLYIFCLVLMLLAVALVHRIVTSPFGHVLRAIRDNRDRALTLGYKPERYQWIVYTLSAGLAGLGGGLKALVLQVVTLTDLHLTNSAEPILMTLVGGIGTLSGPVIGASVIVAIQYYLSPFGAWVTVLQGLIFIACVLAFKSGVVGLLSAIEIRIRQLRTRQGDKNPKGRTTDEQERS